MIQATSAEATVFAVEDTTAQICWKSLPAGTVLRAGDSSIEVAHGGGPGAGVLEGLPADRRLDLFLERPGRPAARVLKFRTLAPPPGEELCRFATVNDVHVGERHFGLLGTLREPVPDQTYAVRCLGAALAEAQAWGARAVVAKGDLTCHGDAPEWEDAARLLGGLPVPVAAVVGNHDVMRGAIDGRPALAAAGVVLGDDPFHLDLPGIRLVLAHTAVARRSHGRIGRAQRDQVTDLVAGAPGPAYVGMHHYLPRFPVPLGYPLGVVGRGGGALLDALAAANPATFLSSGHSHRNRRRRHGPLVITQIGATMHYPGVWAGYVVHEGGIRQVVRRVAEPSAIAWTERSGRALLGAWRPWAAGLRSHRCFSHAWPAVSSA